MVPLTFSSAPTIEDIKTLKTEAATDFFSVPFIVSSIGFLLSKSLLKLRPDLLFKIFEKKLKAMSFLIFPRNSLLIFLTYYIPPTYHPHIIKMANHIAKYTYSYTHTHHMPHKHTCVIPAYTIHQIQHINITHIHIIHTTQIFT